MSKLTIKKEKRDVENIQIILLGETDIFEYAGDLWFVTNKTTEENKTCVNLSTGAIAVLSNDSAVVAAEGELSYKSSIEVKA